MRQTGLILGVTCFVSAMTGCTWYAPPEPSPQLAQLNWLVGDWTTAMQPGESATEEHWMPPSTSNMFGISRSLENGREVSIEYLRLTVQSNGLIYYAAPGGRLPATPFRAVECDSHHAIFENREHDYPQRIIYELQFGGTIKARIEGHVNGEMKSSEWVFHRMH